MNETIGTAHILHTSPRTLAKAVGGAAVAAGLALTLFVLPAEANIDPTGLGSLLGLTRMAVEKTGASASAAPSQPAAVVAAPDKASIARGGKLRSDSMTIALAPHSGAEVKAHMKTGDSFVFRWESQGGPVKADMHGERVNAPEGEFTSYWVEKQLTAGQGSFTAPFEGIHGWYWRNKGDTPVTVTVKTTGFYQDLFRPHAE
jgi:hypothetical protein